MEKACFQYDTAYGDFKDLARRTASEIVLRDATFKITKNPKYDGYQWGIASMVYQLFDKKYSGCGVIQNRELPKKLHKPIIRKFEKRKAYSSSKDNIWGVDMQLRNKFDKGSRFYFALLIFILYMHGVFL